MSKPTIKTIAAILNLTKWGAATFIGLSAANVIPLPIWLIVILLLVAVLNVSDDVRD